MFNIKKIKSIEKIRKIYIVICLVMVMQITLPTLNNAYAKLTDNFTLIKSDIVTITKKTRVEDINKAYGSEAKIITKTPHGGHAYTWHRENYTDIIYIETNEYEQIVSAGICAGEFESTLCNYGDSFISNLSYMQGSTIYNRNQEVLAAFVYNKDTLNVDKYMTEYMKDPSSYDKYLAKHALVIVNQFLIKNGYSETQFNEELYDKVQRIVDSGISIDKYAKKNKKDSLYKYGGMLGADYMTLYECLPNPIKLASYNKGLYLPSDVCNNIYLRYHIKDPSSKHGADITVVYLSEDIVNSNDTFVPLNEEEQQKYEKAKKIYEDSVNIFNSSGRDTFKTEPNYKTLPLTAGEIYENKLIATTMFLNTIRVGAGMPEVEHDKTLSDYAQHKAVLTVYMSANNIPNPNPHTPEKPDGVDDDFYNKAMSGMSAENLYSGSDIITTISNAINDAYGDPITCGHRYNLLNPSTKYFGLGFVKGQGCHKFSGVQSYSNINAVTWPSIGITPTESYTGGYWSIDLYSYSTTDATTVDIVRLNDNRKWTFTERTTEGSNRLYVRSKYISLYNSSLTGNDGEVYQITVHNLKAGDREVPEFTYRAAFKSLYGEDVIPVNTEFVKLDKSNISMNALEKAQLTPSFSEGATEIATNWSSSNENVATVSGYGTITAKGKGEATITVTTVNGKSATCKVVVNPTVILKENSNILKVNETSKIELMEELDNVTYTSSNNNIARVDSNGNITTVSAGMCKITVSKDGYKEATYYIYVKDPITFSDNTRGYVGDTNLDGIIDYADYTYISKNKGTANAKNKELCDLNKDGIVNELDLEILDSFASQGKIIYLSYAHIENVTLDKSELTIQIGDRKSVNASITPEDVVDSTVLNWKSSNSNIVDVDQNGNITAKNIGTALITVTTSNGKQATLDVNVINYVKGDFDENGDVNIFDVYSFLVELSKGTTFTDRQILIMDMDGDTKANIFDAYELLVYLSTKI